MNTGRFSPKAFLKTLTMLYSFMLGFVFIFAMLALFFNIDKPSPEFKSYASLLYVSVFVLIAMYVIGFVIMRGEKEKGIKAKLISQKFEHYRKGIITKLALLEGAAIFSVVAFLLTNSMVILSIAAVVAVLFRFNRPTRERIIKILQLNNKEQKQFD